MDPEQVDQNSFTNYYEILGVPRDATIEDIEMAYQKLEYQAHHEDRVIDMPESESSQLAFLNLEAAKEALRVLSDENSRKEYDSQLGYIGHEN
jgi:DnaJ-class molecular chaperone